jgi:hypothetical protein
MESATVALMSNASTATAGTSPGRPPVLGSCWPSGIVSRITLSLREVLSPPVVAAPVVLAPVVSSLVVVPVGAPVVPVVPVVLVPVVVPVVSVVPVVLVPVVVPVVPVVLPAVLPVVVPVVPVVPVPALWLAVPYVTGGTIAASGRGATSEVFREPYLSS